MEEFVRYADRKRLQYITKVLGEKLPAGSEVLEKHLILKICEQFILSSVGN